MRASANGPPITLRDPLELGTDTSSPAGDCEDGAWASPHATGPDDACDPTYLKAAEECAAKQGKGPQPSSRCHPARPIRRPVPPIPFPHSPGGREPDMGG
jgi:hypothetical protein